MKVKNARIETVVHIPAGKIVPRGTVTEQGGYEMEYLPDLGCLRMTHRDWKVNGRQMTVHIPREKVESFELMDPSEFLKVDEEPKPKKQKSKDDNFTF